jgi:hypothetical protein
MIGHRPLLQEVRASLLSGSAGACVPRTGKNERITARTIAMKGAKRLRLSPFLHPYQQDFDLTAERSDAQRADHLDDLPILLLPFLHPLPGDGVARQR